MAKSKGPQKISSGISWAEIKKPAELMIKKAVEEAFMAGKQSREDEKRDAYRSTEARLFALPVNKKKLEHERERLQQLEKDQEPERIGHSKDVIRFRRGGRRLTDEEVLSVQICEAQARIACLEHEIDEIEKALDLIKDDEYFEAMCMRYEQKLSDDEAAEQLKCNPSTVRRNRGRMVRELAVWLYGPAAV